MNISSKISNIDVITFENLNDDIIQLEKKYKKNDNCEKYDPFNFLIEMKNDTIDDLKREINGLKQEIIDLTIIYNNKIENLRTQHKNDLYLQYKEYIKKCKELKEKYTKIN